MNDDLFDSIFENFVLSADIEIIKKVLFPFSYVIFLVDEVIDVFEILVNIEFLPKHGRKLHG